jgi:hypothetical protein
MAEHRLSPPLAGIQSLWPFGPDNIHLFAHDPASLNGLSWIAAAGEKPQATKEADAAARPEIIWHRRVGKGGWAPASFVGGHWRLTSRFTVLEDNPARASPQWKTLAADPVPTEKDASIRLRAFVGLLATTLVWSRGASIAVCSSLGAKSIVFSALAASQEPAPLCQSHRWLDRRVGFENVLRRHI